MRRVEKREAAVFLAIGAAHVLIAVLLVRALVESGVLPKSASMAVYNVANAAAPTLAAPEPQASPISVETQVLAPDLPKPQKLAERSAAPTYDPFGGAALRSNAPAAISTTGFVGASASTSGSILTQENITWLEELKRRLRSRKAGIGDVHAPAVFEVLARPAGGFVDIRLKASTGSPDIDQELLEAIMARQSLVPVGMVDKPVWIPIPQIAF